MRMQGNKGKYFILNLSFIGWSLLFSIPTGIVEGAFTFSESVVAYQLLSLLAMIPYIWLGAYIFLTQVAFYEILLGNLKAEPITPELPQEV